MIKSGILLIIVLFFSAYSSALYAQRTVSGTVFLDGNGNNRMDAPEEGIPNVAVSNGREVVLSDAKSNYELPIEEEMIVSIRKPAGYKLPLNENNLPQYFYYIHQPNGSPALKYPGLEPTGALPQKVNFGLFPSEKKKSFTAKCRIIAPPTKYGPSQPRKCNSNTHNHT